MLNTNTLNKMNQLKTALEANPEFVDTVKTDSDNAPELLLSFAQLNGIDVSAEELDAFFTAINADNQELDDSLLEMIAGGQKWFEFWKTDWWKGGFTSKHSFS